ncbi:MAG: GNAT family N-acetyltransferase [Burkholderiales bacterium]|nr:MAG: GNAT family N-acetyltransferase [Burkholderiales bacterium]
MIGQIRVDDLTHPKVHALLAEHLAAMHANSPLCGVHALELSALRAPEVTLWTAWDGDDLLGCGALTELDPTHGEVKSMRTAAGRLRRGVARAILAVILETARERGYRRVSLETGSTEAFEPALRLYQSFGFSYCGPFGQYRENAFSRFMTKSPP